MLEARPDNPLLQPKPAPEADLGQIRRATHARSLRQSRRDIRDLRRKETAEEALAGFDDSIEIFGLTKGQFSLIDLLEAALARTGPGDLYISTWTAANTDVSRVLEFIDTGRIVSARWLVDLTFTRRTPQLAARIRAAFGPDAIRVTRNHAKFAMVINDRWKLVVRTSMNLNFNPRLEDYTIANDPALADFLGGVFDDIWKKQDRRLGDDTPATVKRWFDDAG